MIASAKLTWPSSPIEQNAISRQALSSCSGGIEQGPTPQYMPAKAGSRSFGASRETTCLSLLVQAAASGEHPQWCSLRLLVSMNKR